MKTIHWPRMLATVAVVGLMASVGPASAQTTPLSSPPPVAVTAPTLAYGVPQILQLTQAKIGDDTVIAYINNSRINYGLDANQIIYLRQQGVSEAVVTAMLNQPKPGMVASAAPTYAPQPAPPAPSLAPAQPAPPVTYVQSAPAVTYVQSAPPVTYYYSDPYYYPSYGYYYPPVSLSFGWGWGGGWRGGGGGWHGGGGGFHGGGGGFHGGHR